MFTFRYFTQKLGSLITLSALILITTSNVFAQDCDTHADCGSSSWCYSNGDGDSYSKNIYSKSLENLNKPLLDIFLNNIEIADLMSFTIPCPGYGHEWGERLSIPIDLVFIDGNHEYSAVLSDYELWEPKLVPGGIIVFHDVRGGHPGPQRVFEEKIHPPKWKDIRFADSLAFAKKVE